MEYPVSELLDRLSITDLKLRHLGEEVRVEYEALLAEFGRLCTLHPEWKLGSHYAKLFELNAEIWGYESDLRDGKLGEYDVSCFEGTTPERLYQLAAVGQAALNIRNANLNRCQIKNKLVELTGSGFAEVKVNHASGVAQCQ